MVQFFKDREKVLHLFLKKSSIYFFRPYIFKDKSIQWIFFYFNL